MGRVWSKCHLVLLLNSKPDQHAPPCEFPSHLPLFLDQRSLYYRILHCRSRNGASSCSSRGVPTHNNVPHVVVSRRVRRAGMVSPFRMGGGEGYNIRMYTSRNGEPRAKEKQCLNVVRLVHIPHKPRPCLERTRLKVVTSRSGLDPYESQRVRAILSKTCRRKLTTAVSTPRPKSGTWRLRVSATPGTRRGRATREGRPTRDREGCRGLPS